MNGGASMPQQSEKFVRYFG